MIPQTSTSLDVNMARRKHKHRNGTVSRQSLSSEGSPGDHPGPQVVGRWALLALQVLRRQDQKHFLRTLAKHVAKCKLYKSIAETNYKQYGRPSGGSRFKNES